MRLVPGGESVLDRQRGTAEDVDMIPTGRQIREARGLVGMKQAALAAAAEVAVALVARIEATDSLPMVRRQDSAAIQAGLEDAGVEFILENGKPGVQLRDIET